MSQQQGKSRLNLEGAAYLSGQASDNIPSRRLCAGFVGNQRSTKFGKNQISTQCNATVLSRYTFTQQRSTPS